MYLEQIRSNKTESRLAECGGLVNELQGIVPYTRVLYPDTDADLYLEGALVSSYWMMVLISLIVTIGTRLTLEHSLEKVGRKSSHDAYKIKFNANGYCTRYVISHETMI
jgi:hypothetical protein